MSWDATLTDHNGTVLGDWNYTGNTSPMIYAVLEEAGIDLGTWTAPDGTVHGYSWWSQLNGTSGPGGAGYLHTIIQGLEADPDRFTAMNPSNGWGDYEGLVKILTEMRNAVPEWPARWEACG